MSDLCYIKTKHSLKKRQKHQKIATAIKEKNYINSRFSKFEKQWHDSPGADFDGLQLCREYDKQTRRSQ
jgi:hypothetical protein